MGQDQSSGPPDRLAVSLGLIMRLRIVAREHHTVADAARFGSTPLARISNADVRSSSRRPTRQRPRRSRRAWWYSPGLSAGASGGDSGNRDFHSSRNPSGQHQLGPCLDQPVAVEHMLQVLEQLAEVKSRFGQWATGYRVALPQNYVAYGLNGTCTLRL